MWLLAILGRAGEWPLAVGTPQAGRARSTPSLEAVVYLDYTYYINILEDAYGC